MRMLVPSCCCCIPAAPASTCIIPQHRILSFFHPCGSMHLPISLSLMSFNSSPVLHTPDHIPAGPQVQCSSSASTWMEVYLTRLCRLRTSSSSADILENQHPPAIREPHKTTIWARKTHTHTHKRLRRRRQDRKKKITAPYLLTTTEVFSRIPPTREITPRNHKQKNQERTCQPQKKSPCKNSDKPNKKKKQASE